MAEHPFKIAGPDRREGSDWFTFRVPSHAAQGLFGLASVQAANIAGIVPTGRAEGLAVFAAAALVLLKGCVYRR
ncbi:hypothetical protein [Streptomyces sp. NPDC002588]|uniref:hypothetical protein n=1 Tax=Streptomyces sp. NPDC002588 TaxID=3154419 RepID=UPI003328BBC5